MWLTSPLSFRQLPDFIIKQPWNDIWTAIQNYRTSPSSSCDIFKSPMPAAFSRNGTSWLFLIVLKICQKVKLERVALSQYKQHEPKGMQEKLCETFDSLNGTDGSWDDQCVASYKGIIDSIVMASGIPDKPKFKHSVFVLLHPLLFDTFIYLLLLQLYVLPYIISKLLKAMISKATA